MFISVQWSPDFFAGVIFVVYQRIMKKMQISDADKKKPIVILGGILMRKETSKKCMRAKPLA